MLISNTSIENLCRSKHASVTSTDPQDVVIENALNPAIFVILILVRVRVRVRVRVWRLKT